MINVLIKPASSDCNLRCKYCFYHDVANNREEKTYGLMSLETLETIVKKTLDSESQTVGFTFQGGEPTLVGLQFYKELIKFQNKYNKNKITINNSIQTNGTLINAEWAKFFSENNFLVGVSLDGNKVTHNTNRIDTKGLNTFDLILNNIRILERYGVDFNIVTVVTDTLVSNLAKVYKFYTDNNFKYLQFIPCLDEFEEKKSENIQYLTNTNYGIFLNKLFDLWYEDFKNGIETSIRMFDNIMFMMVGYPPESCDMSGRCTVNPIIESDGSVYPCDFYALDQWKIGNIHDSPLEDIRKSIIGKKFVNESKFISEKCRSCDYYKLCRGGCRRHYEPLTNGKIEGNYFCQAYKSFYKYTLPRFREVLKTLQKR